MIDFQNGQFPLEKGTRGICHVTFSLILQTSPGQRHFGKVSIRIIGKSDEGNDIFAGADVEHRFLEDGGSDCFHGIFWY